MFWLLQRIVDRLWVKLAVVLASKFESEAELELSEMRAEMLRCAAELETEEVAGFGDLAAELREGAKTLGQRERGPAGDALETAEGFSNENLRDPSRLRICGDGVSRDLGASGLSALPGPSGKKRGRPRKNAPA